MSKKSEVADSEQNTPSVKWYQQLLQRNRNKAELYLNDPTRMQKLLVDVQRKGKVAIDTVGPLAALRDEMALMWRMLRAWQQGKYKHAPRGVLLSAVAALIYFVVPLDLLPDFIVGTGFFDDAAVIAFALRSITGDLRKFADWETVEEAKRIIDADAARQAEVLELSTAGDNIAVESPSEDALWTDVQSDSATSDGEVAFADQEEALDQVLDELSTSLGWRKWLPGGRSATA